MHNLVAVALFVFLLCQPATAADRFVPSGEQIHLARVHLPEDIKFAREQLIRYLGVVKPTEWDRTLQSGEVKIGRADLNDDGTQEVFIVVENSLWCGSVGCTGIILQKRQDHWEIMEKPNFPGDQVIIMEEKRFGYHKVFTGDDIYTFRDGKTYEILDINTRQITR